MSAKSVICSGCGERFESNFDFNLHDCPTTPKPLDGESFEDYKARCDRQKSAFICTTCGECSLEIHAKRWCPTCGSYNDPKEEEVDMEPIVRLLRRRERPEFEIIEQGPDGPIREGDGNGGQS